MAYEIKYRITAATKGDTEAKVYLYEDGYEGEIIDYPCTIYQLQVVMWGEKRGIIQNSDSKTQLLKAFSEMGELADAITKRDRDGIVDGLGDVLVCLTMVAAIEDVDLKHCFASAYEEIKNRKGYLNREGVFVKD